MTADLDRLALEYDCRRCGACPGYWCFSVASGASVGQLHAARTGPLLAAHRLGAQVGRERLTEVALVPLVRFGGGQLLTLRDRGVA